MYQQERKDKFEYTITETVCTLSTYQDTAKELNWISYGKRDPKLDIRNWKHGEDGDRMLKGITLNREEARALREALNQMNL